MNVSTSGPLPLVARAQTLESTMKGLARQQLDGRPMFTTRGGLGRWIRPALRSALGCSVAC